uniref:Selenoprotein W n=1 Tax=Astyanax mexicanus TaxID=7994 RepID=A0A8B9K0B7_ASTMX
VWFVCHDVYCCIWSGESTPRTSGWFEVEVNGKLVHSKKNGDGFVDSDQKMAKIVSAIEKSIGK